MSNFVDRDQRVTATLNRHIVKTISLLNYYCTTSIMLSHQQFTKVLWKSYGWSGLTPKNLCKQKPNVAAAAAPLILLAVVVVVMCNPKEMRREFPASESLTHQVPGLSLAPTGAPCGLWGCKNIDPLRFLAGCHKRRLNKALSVLSLSLGFF